jgi:hypothetical protein
MWPVNERKGFKRKGRWHEERVKHGFVEEMGAGIRGVG